jgi:release factor glutamine methyltransferase
MKFFYKDLVLEVPETVYYPREDSLLLAKIIEDEGMEERKILDMGTGSGFLSILMAKSNADVTAADINKEALQVAERNAKINNAEIKTIHSDLFEKIEEKFDLIVFNPPYLPEKMYKDIQYHGGKGGRKVIQKFINKAADHLRESGKILLLISSITGEKEVKELFETHGYKTKILARQKVPWEELIVVEAKRF